MVDKFLRDNPRIGSAKKLIVYTDSCGGQNRNNYVLAYFTTRICAGFHDSISWNFLLVGHTKFSPDRGFALVRNAEKKNTIRTMKHWINVINGIGEGEEGEYCTAEEMTEFRQWKALALPFNKFDGIKKLDVEELQFTKGRSNTCNVTYKLISETEFKQVCIKRTKMLKDLRDLSLDEVPDWPTEDILKENLPEPLLLIPLAFKRWQDLVKGIKTMVEPLSIQEQTEVLEYWENLRHVEQGNTESPQVEGNKRAKRTEVDRCSMQATAHAMASRARERERERYIERDRERYINRERLRKIFRERERERHM